MEIVIYTDSLSVDKSYNQVKVSMDVDVEDMLNQLDAVPKADYDALHEEYTNLVDKHSELQEAYDELRS